MNNMKARISYRAHVDSVNSISFGYKSNIFISGSADKTLSLWDMRTYICSQTYYGHNNSINSAVINNDGYTMASCDSDGIVKIWDNRMNKEVFILYNIEHHLMSVKRVLMSYVMT